MAMDASRGDPHILHLDINQKGQTTTRRENLSSPTMRRNGRRILGAYHLNMVESGLTPSTNTAARSQRLPRCSWAIVSQLQPSPWLRAPEQPPTAHNHPLRTTTAAVNSPFENLRHISPAWANSCHGCFSQSVRPSAPLQILFTRLVH